MHLAAIDNIEHAQQVVNAYGALLSKLGVVNTGYPQSLLPYSKEQIKQAIQILLWEFDESETEVRDSLAQAYVFLEQFIPDLQADVLNKGQAALRSGDPHHRNWDCADEAGQIMAQIKLAMENALQDVQLFLH